MRNFLYIFTGISGFIAVLMGAAAAHWLQSTIPPERIVTINKASEYQIYHTLALLVIAALQNTSGRAIKAAALLFCIGIILFSGSLYLYALTQVHWLVYITPLGGMSLMAGWIAIFIHGIGHVRR